MDPAFAGDLLGAALCNGYRPRLSTIPYCVPKARSSSVVRIAWAVQVTYALAPDLLVLQLTGDPHQIAIAQQSPLPGALAVASALAKSQVPLHEPITAAWTHAFMILTARDARLRAGLEQATRGNPYPLAARYNERQPFVRLDTEPANWSTW